MLNPTLIATLVTLPAIFAQSTNTTASAGTNNTGATSSSNTTAQPSDSTAASSSTFAPTNFTPVTVSGTTCGSAQQNLNQCITKVGKDISSCTDNVCLCQTYANIAACYNGCAELVDQGKQYQAQSSQYCSVAGVKPNTTATVTPPAASAPTTSTSSPNTSPVRTNTTSNPSSNAGTFSASKAAAVPGAKVSTAGLLVAVASGLVALCL
ncbi:hypothetical protein PGTUg99_022962 [Puccinia graminis f. sp. tritici]|uniref:Extracellular membrane protein CFEM domain-containing protein n=2 Tax=Puccinia graminis f. sp. tritici TaxID=56615 RepID=E3LBP1_PUCGT|nr:uncharacterized protein PGTG_19738 [Puccinia graminis f. sp. tritici CRL 75-36-700-3]EFP93966.1 hypothetical protein PGTG_19738 [Puccinia graminis f. sp. tritici CRL 75-36-700-3]KAA1086487.1 hypothetical protein PGTUg99_022962 [Puccinia graminis f. sp. tritici]